MKKEDYTGLRVDKRTYRHTCNESKEAGDSRNHRNESRIMLGPFGLGILNMDIDADWCHDKRNKSIYVPCGTFCPYCGVNIKLLLDKANVKRGESTPY